ncbi:MAG: hypothetical protein ACLFTT_04210 [Candidatus Hydrogenedentota bacterium]
MTPTPDSRHLKSYFLTRFLDDPESEGAKRFRRHLREFLEDIDASTRESTLSKLGEMRAARTSYEKDAIVQSLAPKDTEQHAKIEHSFSLLDFFVDLLLKEEIPDNDYQKWVDDFVSLEWITESSRGTLVNILEELTTKHLQQLQFEATRRRAEGGVLPVFKSIGITVEARAVQEDYYRWGMPLEGEGAYSPEIISTAMIASVHIGVDEGFPKDFWFQMDERDIDNFVAKLLAAKKEMNGFREYLRIGPDGKVEHNG